MRSEDVRQVSEGGSGGRAEKIVIRVLRVLFLIAFLGSVSGLIRYCLEYRDQASSQRMAVKKYIQEAAVPEISAGAQEEAITRDISGESTAARCPITVDFDALLSENEDIAGWLYCEDTNINYPVVQGKDNDYYLHHTYDRKESRAGAIFVDAENRPQFADSNTIIYGHHMKNGSMFARLADFADQEYFDAHPVMWLLTPEQTYQVELLGGYLTTAGSDSYTIFTGECEEFEDYLSEVITASDVQAEMQMPPDGRYIMLSTCEYDFEDARYVLHGRLKP